MKVKTYTVYRGTEILNRPNGWEGVPTTVDFTNVTDTIDGVKVVKAGTPMDAIPGDDGKNLISKAANDATTAGILISDVFESYPIGTILKKAYINKARASDHSGVTISEAALGVLPMIVLE